MVPPKGGNVLDVLSKFRNDMAKAQKTQAEAAKEREEKIKKVKSGGDGCFGVAKLSNR